MYKVLLFVFCMLRMFASSYQTETVRQLAVKLEAKNDKDESRVLIALYGAYK